MKYEAVIGLEVHAELSTKSKIYCSCSTGFGAPINTHTCPVCTGMPGSLPVLNKKVVEFAIKAGLAANCHIHQYCKFDRKNYFYPDNPQNYQISQLYLPICYDGAVEIETSAGKKTVRIHEMHMEEDAGKLIHDEWEDCSLVDYNRSGVPLIEIVSEPDMRSSEEVIAYLEKLRCTMQYLGVSDCKLQEGSMRADVNLSVREVGSETFGTRTEMKNINSFKAIERAIAFEAQRQIDALEFGERIVQETRRWDDNRSKTYSMRSKENAQDYRYFPEPDIPPIAIDEVMMQRLTEAQPEMAEAKQKRYMRDYGMSEKTAGILTEEKHFAEIFERTAALSGEPEETANWLIGHTIYLMGQHKIDAAAVAIVPEIFAKFVKMMASGKVNRVMGKELFEKVFEGDPAFDIESYVQEHHMEAIADDGAIKQVVQAVLDEHEAVIAQYKAGDEKVYGFFIGQCMRRLQGKADPVLVNKLVKEEIAHR